MKMRGFWGIAFLIAFATAGYAAERGKYLSPASDSAVLDDWEGNNQTMIPLTTRFGDYSLMLDADKPRYTGVPDPAGLTPLRQDTTVPFLGLKFSRPLPDNFWNFGDVPAR
jgi:hypothetical protein